MFKKLAALFVALLAVLAVTGLSAPANATESPLDQGAKLSADCGEVTLTFVNGHEHATKDFEYVWRIETSDDQSYKVVVPHSEGTHTEVVKLKNGAGKGWVTFGVIAGPERDYYLPFDSIDVPLCQTPVTPAAPTAPTSTCEKFTDVVLPEQDGVEYTLTWTENNPVSWTAKVTATVLEGYVLTEGAKTEWEFPLKLAENCPGPQGPAGPPGSDGAPGAPGQPGRDGVVVQVPAYINTGR